MRIALLLLLGVAVTSACNKSPQVDEKNASVAEVAEKVRAAGAGEAFVRPGRWASKVTIQEFDVPGMPPEMAQRMKAMMAENQEHDFETCLTAEDVKRPKEDFFAGKNNECRYEHFTMGGGKIDAAMHCGVKDGATQVMQMAGTYSPDSYNMQTSMKMQGAPSGEGAIQMTMRIDAKRVGECTGKENA